MTADAKQSFQLSTVILHVDSVGLLDLQGLVHAVGPPARTAGFAA
jgi:hypothetical protein